MASFQKSVTSEKKSTKKNQKVSQVQRFCLILGAKKSKSVTSKEKLPHFRGQKCQKCHK